MYRHMEESIYVNHWTYSRKRSPLSETLLLKRGPQRRVHTERTSRGGERVLTHQVVWEWYHGGPENGFIFGRRLYWTGSE